MKRLYRESFHTQLSTVTSLDFGGLGWGDVEAAQMAEVLATRTLTSLEQLYLHTGTMSSVGARAILEALLDDSVPRLTKLDMQSHAITDDGALALAEVGHAGALRRLSKFELITCFRF